MDRLARESIHLARRKEIYEAMWPGTRKGSAGGRAKNNVQTENISVSTFAADAANKTGVTERTIRNRTRLGETLGNIADSGEAIPRAWG